MARHLRTSLVAVLVLAATGIWAGTALGAIAPGCANPVNSALNQYCDSIPSSTGSQSPHAGTPSVAATLPRAALIRIDNAGPRSAGGRARARHRHALLSLPAAGPRAPLSAARADITGGAMLPVWLIVTLIALALAMIAATVFARYRRQREG